MARRAVLMEKGNTVTINSTKDRKQTAWQRKNNKCLAKFQKFKMANPDSDIDQDEFFKNNW